MAKYLEQNGGQIREVQPITNSTGVSDGNKIIQTDTTGRIDQSVLPVGVGALVKNIIASENLSAGDFVNIFDNTGTANVRKADASSTGKEAHGYVLDAVTSGSLAAVYFEEFNNQLSAKTPGSQQFLSAVTPGATTETAPTGSGQVVQRLGVAITATEMTVEMAQPIVLI